MDNSRIDDSILDTSRVLCFPDLHFPYCHPDSLDFLYKLNRLLQPTLVIGGGDEIDYHAQSFHNSDPDLDSAGPEFLKALGYIDTLHEIFTKALFLESNHGSMVYRKSKFNGTPRHFIKSYNEALGIPKEDWSWHLNLTLTLPNSSQVHLVHAASANVLMASRKLGMSLIQFHHHSLFEIRYWQSILGKLNFAATASSLVDDNSLAFAYNKVFQERPISGVIFIENSIPQLIPMIVDSNNRWVGTRL